MEGVSGGRGWGVGVGWWERMGSGWGVGVGWWQGAGSGVVAGDGEWGGKRGRSGVAGGDREWGGKRGREVGRCEWDREQGGGNEPCKRLLQKVAC